MQGITDTLGEIIGEDIRLHKADTTGHPFQPVTGLRNGNGGERPGIGGDDNLFNANRFPLPDTLGGNSPRQDHNGCGGTQGNSGSFTAYYKTHWNTCLYTNKRRQHSKVLHAQQAATTGVAT